MSKLRGVVLVCAVVLFVTLVVRVGPAAIAVALRQMSWRLLIVVCFPFPLTAAIDTLGWRFAFLRDRVPFRRLLAARLAAEALNLTTPTATVGGEAAKTVLVRGYVSLEESASSVVVAKTTHVIAQGIFLAAAVTCAWLTLPSDSLLLRGMRWLLLGEAVAVAGFVLVQVVGVLRRLRAVLGRLGLAGLARRLGALGRVEGALSTLCRLQPGRLCLSIAFHFLGWVLGALETYLILLFLGLPVTMATALIVEAFGTALRFATFWVPVGLGVLEGGQMAAFAALGLGAPAGLSFMLARRVLDIAWTGLGFLALATIPRAAPLPARGLAGH